MTTSKRAECKCDLAEAVRPPTLPDMALNGIIPFTNNIPLKSLL